MTKEEIKERLVHFPHIKKVWVKGEEVFFAYRKGAKVIDLESEETEIPKQKKRK